MAVNIFFEDMKTLRRFWRKKCGLLRRVILTSVALVMLSCGLATTARATEMLASLGAGSRSETPPVECKGSSVLPVVLPSGERAQKVISGFDLPAHNWLPGHRGIDVEAAESSTIVAPENGVITFAGSVGGKSSVSFWGNSGVTFSFEPATAAAPKGTKLTKNDIVALVKGHSDHCDGMCVHWGAKRNNSYIDPRLALSPPQILLKPV